MTHDPYQEKLDDPNLPFDLRWSLIKEIDGTNRRFGIYRRFIKDWSSWAMECTGKQKTISILEVGSGSGGLSLEIRKWAQKQGLNPSTHLYDAQEDILDESVKIFGTDRPTTHVATQEHLKVYPDQAFDFVISLHVIHHIQPVDIAISALEEMLRITKLGIFVVDLENKFLAVPFAKAWNSITGVSPQLSEDGIKSLKRSHSPRALETGLLRSDYSNAFNIELKRDFFIPYWRLRGCRKGSRQD